MIGANNREFGFFAPPCGAVDGMLPRFGAAGRCSTHSRDARAARAQGRGRRGLSSDGAMVEPARMTGPSHRRRRPADLRLWLLPTSSSLRSSTKGALHATEIPFVFATVRAKYAGATTAEDEALAAQANAYWAAFAKSGDPNAEGLPKWPAFTAAGDVVMDLGVGGSKAGPDPWKARLDFIERAAQAPPQPRP